MKITREMVIDYLKHLSVEELTKLIAELRIELDIPDTSGQWRETAGAAVVDPTMGMYDPPETIVTLQALGVSKLEVVRVLRKYMTNRSLPELLELVQKLPCVVSDQVENEERQAFARELQTAGATVKTDVSLFCYQLWSACRTSSINAKFMKIKENIVLSFPEFVVGIRIDWVK
jgi:ribosomal protein L7/L12